MADRNFYSQDECNVPKTVELCGVLDITGSSGAVASTSYFPGGTFSRTAAGDYTLTLTDAYSKLVGAAFEYSVNGSTPDNLQAQVYSVDTTTNKTIKFKMVRPYLSGTATFDPANLVDGAGATTTVTVTGAALGDHATASFSLDLQGMSVTPYVSATNTVSVRFQNESGGALDLASGTLSARVYPSAPVAADPAAGSSIFVRLKMRNSGLT